ncbi:phosphopantothenoylcysteine decarboxylase [Acrasis kona]|uniref:Phosphopantothenoylcysteine decarboxylase n=1 Tax=Acrasis kona TaxID=1008807 RepID=A0AAW2YVG2_9EUKA
MACVNCSKLHKKCNGDSPVPCSRCASKGLDCVYMERRKRGPKSKRLKCSGSEDEYDCTDSQSTPIPYAQRMNQQPIVYNNIPPNVPLSQLNANGAFSALSSVLGQHTTFNQQYNPPQPMTSCHPINQNQPTNNNNPQLEQVKDEVQPKLSSFTFRTIKLLVCATGSVAAIKLPELIGTFMQSQSMSTVPMRFDICVAMTDAATHFCQLNEIKTNITTFLKKQSCTTNELSKEEASLVENLRIFTDKDEWAAWTKRGDPVNHVEKWADVLLIAPLDANTLAKIANGLYVRLSCVGTS